MSRFLASITILVPFKYACLAMAPTNDVPEEVRAVQESAVAFLEATQIPDFIVKEFPQIAGELKDDKMISAFKSKMPVQTKSGDEWYLGGGWTYVNKESRLTMSFPRPDSAVIISIRVERKKDGSAALTYQRPTYVKKM